MMIGLIDSVADAVPNVLHLVRAAVASTWLRAGCSACLDQLRVIETFRIPPIVSKWTIRIPDERGWRPRQAATLQPYNSGAEVEHGLIRQNAQFTS